MLFAEKHVRQLVLRSRCALLVSDCITPETALAPLRRHAVELAARGFKNPMQVSCFGRKQHWVFEATDLIMMLLAALDVAEDLTHLIH